jgi:hypothetical protein
VDPTKTSVALGVLVNDKLEIGSCACTKNTKVELSSNDRISTDAILDGVDIFDFRMISPCLVRKSGTIPALAVFNSCRRTVLEDSSMSKFFVNFGAKLS